MKRSQFGTTSCDLTEKEGGKPAEEANDLVIGIKAYQKPAFKTEI